ncbi:MAG: hypothetical protein AAF530_07085 [Pseudomonadota bacterium]
MSLWRDTSSRWLAPSEADEDPLARLDKSSENGDEKGSEGLESPHRSGKNHPCKNHRSGVGQAASDHDDSSMMLGKDDGI